MYFVRRVSPYVVPKQVRGLILDLDLTLIGTAADGSRFALPGAVAWCREAFLFAPRSLAFCTGQSKTSAAECIKSLLEMCGRVPEQNWICSAAKSLSQQPFLEALRILELEAREVLVVDDNPGAIANALVLGCQVVWVSNRAETELVSELLARRDELPGGFFATVADPLDSVLDVSSIRFKPER